MMCHACVPPSKNSFVAATAWMGALFDLLCAFERLLLSPACDCPSLRVNQLSFIPLLIEGDGIVLSSVPSAYLDDQGKEEGLQGAGATTQVGNGTIATTLFFLDRES